MGIATGVLLALERHGKYPFDGGGSTSDDLRELLANEYLVEIDHTDLGSVAHLLNAHPKMKIKIADAGDILDQADVSNPH